MSDLVERLRGCSGPNFNAVCHEAAAELERLQAENANLRAAHAHALEGNPQTVSCKTAVARLQAEVERLRKDAERWKHASTSRNFGITNWCEFGQRTSYDAYAAQLVDAAMQQEPR